jgi:hypothetical protein
MTMWPHIRFDAEPGCSGLSSQISAHVMKIYAVSRHSRKIVD